MVTERRYREDDLTNARKSDLVDMVRRQPDRWPGKTFNASKTNVATLKHHLLTAGFTRELEDGENGDNVDVGMLNQDNFETAPGAGAPLNNAQSAEGGSIAPLTHALDYLKASATMLQVSLGSPSNTAHSHTWDSARDLHRGLACPKGHLQNSPNHRPVSCTHPWK